MSDRLYYQTAFSGFLAEGILLRDDYINEGGDHGYLVECVGAAPMEAQPWDPDDPWPGSEDIADSTVREVWEIYDPYLSGEEIPEKYDHQPEPHVVWENDVVRRFAE